MKLTLVSIRQCGYSCAKKSTNTVVDKFVILGTCRNIEDVIKEEVEKDRKILETNDVIVSNGYWVKSTYKIDGEFFIDRCVKNFTDND